MKKKNVYVVFGGTFDPFTAAHKRIVQKIQEKFKAGDPDSDTSFQLVIAPSIVSWHRQDKDKFLTYSQRLSVIYQMLEKDKIDGYYYFNVWMGEWDRAAMLKDNPKRDEILSKRGFIDTLQDIMANYTSFHDIEDESKESEWYFVIGSDQLEMFKKWKNWETILSLAKMIVVNGRNGKVCNDYKEEFGYDEIFLEPEYEVESASKLREQWKDKGYEAFYDYITEKYALDEKVYTRLETPIFTVTSGPEVAPNFAPIRVKAPDWVTVMVMKEGKFLVEKQFRYGSNTVIEEFPCGMVEEGEDPLDAAVRELEEETGYKLLDKKDLNKMGATSPNPAFMTNTMHYFFVNLDYAKYEVTSQKLDEHEKITFMWKNADRFMFDLADDAHAENGRVVPAIALSAVKLFENLSNYPCGG